MKKAGRNAVWLFLHVGGGDGTAGGVPDAQDTHMPLVFPDMKNDPVNTVPFAVQQMAGGIAKFFCLGSDGTPGGKLVQAENGLE
jgi:hypothetical protein